MNERKTENIVRDILRKNGYYESTNSVTVEEQQSDLPKIKKMLKYASKKGVGCGYPEFIIRSSKHPNLLILIECKPDPCKHKSETSDKYAEYAVDGVLLYASYCSKEYDVLAIAVSGQTKKEMIISHHLMLKESNDHHDIFNDKILSFEEYSKGIISSPVKYNYDFTEFLAYAKELNEELHAKKVEVKQRALFVSGILLAVKQKPFLASYSSYTDSNALVRALLNAINDELTQSGIQIEKIGKLKSSFAFIEHLKCIVDEPKGLEFLVSVIKGVNEKVDNFTNAHGYVDVVSQFYIEFLRYANSDKSLGIVLTPPHITELFVELAGVDQKSTVLDNCCGTGGFLISAMKRMISLSNNDPAMVKKIKNEQLIGIEYQNDIYALLVSNMIMHNDGRTNCLHEDCFSAVLEVKDKYKPTVGLLNPPYKSKNSDIEEWEFVLNNLSFIQPNGICVALLPVSCVNDSKSKMKSLKKRILQSHTLEAVLSLPDELFTKSDANVVTCAVLITAHRPHPTGKETWFGYCRDDGFVKVKNKGRIDKFNTWSIVKNKWITAYTNKLIEDGFSLTKCVTEKDEWCVEAYMQTDYSKIKLEDFQTVVKNFIVFKLLNNSITNEQDEENES